MNGSQRDETKSGPSPLPLFLGPNVGLISVIAGAAVSLGVLLMQCEDADLFDRALGRKPPAVTETDDPLPHEKETKVHYNDRVKVVSGFYAGQEGHAVRILKDGAIEVKMRFHYGTMAFPESAMEVIPGPERSAGEKILDIAAAAGKWKGLDGDKHLWAESVIRNGRQFDILIEGSSQE